MNRPVIRLLLGSLGCFFAATAQADCTTVQTEAMTPWGRATVVETACPLPTGQTRLRQDFQLSTRARIKPADLPHMRASFLQQHKCTADVIHATPLLDANGVNWPQLQLAGRCAAAEQYRSVYLLVNQRLYRLGISQPLFGPAARESLDKALQDWVREFATDTP